VQPEIERIRKSAAVVAECLDLAGTMMHPGVSTGEIDEAVEKLIRSYGAQPSFKGYHGYPKATCISINDQVVHGIPGERKLVEGDIVGLDVGAFLDGFHGDAARTYAVGEVSEEAQRLMKVTQDCLRHGIEKARAGNSVGDISSAIQKHAESNGFNVVRQLVGHGIGRSLHEEPQVPNFGTAGRGPKLRAGMVLAIEPMVNEGTHEVYTLDDEWTVVTKDHKNSAHYEHTVVIAEDGPVILTVGNGLRGGR
jgi:methionyl aminopeptidase